MKDPLSSSVVVWQSASQKGASTYVAVFCFCVCVFCFSLSLSLFTHTETHIYIYIHIYILYVYIHVCIKSFIYMAPKYPYRKPLKADVYGFWNAPCPGPFNQDVGSSRICGHGIPPTAAERPRCRRARRPPGRVPSAAGLCLT